MLKGTKKFASEMMQDTEGGYSAKRLGLFVLIATFIILVFLNVLGGFPVSDKILDSVVTMVTWMGGFIAAEKLPNVLPGKKDPPAAPAA